ncbi:hypothetical protein CYY_007441 [Polysphondylium violaceum]|uniref:Uncharacterized protein n=1 Tax=Polysphondylium violaceum TaxID=133409 RepID=A0A8J4PRW0_9MYCE|nr:hypothetical protein CYY_007441 [Polysphondylium violaceum]
MVVYTRELKVSSVPDSVTELTLATNKFTAKSIPSSVRHLCFADSFFEEILRAFGDNHNQIIQENVLPKSLTSLEFGSSQRYKVPENFLPKSLVNFKTGEIYVMALGVHMNMNEDIDY